MKPTATNPQLRILFWETTKSCNLQCIHCRAGEEHVGERGELTEEEAIGFIDQLLGYSSDTVLILSGGEPLLRQDIYRLASYASKGGLRVALATNGTLVDENIAGRIADAGVERISISLDGACPETHDSFRGLEGSFDNAVRGLKILMNKGIPVQINTTIARHNLSELEELYRIAVDLGVVALHFFLIVPVGCGVHLRDSEMITPQEYEEVLGWIYRKSLEGPIELKPTCAPHYVRIAAEGKKKLVNENAVRSVSKKQGGHPLSSRISGCLAGKSVVFLSNRGEIFPCGYFPVSAGNIRKATLEEILTGSELLESLRNPDNLKGKCSGCRYKKMCGGCRARAYAVSGDWLGEEPYCIYETEDKPLL